MIADRAGKREQHGVAVGRAARGLARADVAAGARPVLDHDVLSERLAHALADEARHDVVAAARRERHHQRDRPRGINVGALRVHGEHRRYQRQQGEGRASGKSLQLVRDTIAQAPSAAVLRWGGYIPAAPSLRRRGPSQFQVRSKYLASMHSPGAKSLPAGHRTSAPCPLRPAAIYVISDCSIDRARRVKSAAVVASVDRPYASSLKGLRRPVAARSCRKSLRRTRSGGERLDAGAARLQA